MDTVDAGWFVDPVGTFSGRFFDGENWTDQVSDQGVLQIDQDWCSAIDDSKVDDSGVSDSAGAHSSTAGSASYGYDPVILAAPAATQHGGRNDRRQVQIPVSVDRRRGSCHSEPQDLGSPDQRCQGGGLLFL